MAIRKVRLKTRGMFNTDPPDDTDYQLWQEISEYMDGETAFVLESSFMPGKYVLLNLEDAEKDKELHYMMEQDSMVGTYNDDREEFDKDWDSGNYEPDGCHYLNPENVELLESEVQRNV